MKVRIFAGPNGSGKSTLIYSFAKGLKLNLGFFINADEIEKDLNNHRKIDFPVALVIQPSDFTQFLISSTLNTKYNLRPFSNSLIIQKNSILLVDDNISINSYVSAAIADFLRNECLKQKVNFSFETVFSDFRKVQFAKKLKDAGYEIYFYFVCTLNVAINVSRVKQRVVNNGHNVSEEKIIERYQKSIDNAIKVKPYIKRFFVIDNSQKNNPEILLELENNKKTNYINKTFFPLWAEPFKINN